MTDRSSDPAASVPHAALEPRRFRRSTTARTHAFSALATMALLLPGAAGVAWTTWHGVDGGLVVVSLLATFLFGFPPVAASGRASLGQVLTRAACAVGSAAPFAALAISTADGPVPDASMLALAAVVLCVLAGLSRRGGWVHTATVSALVLFAFVAPSVVDRVITRVAPGSSTPDAALAGEDSADGDSTGAEAEGRGRVADIARVRLELSGPLRSAVVRADGLAPLRLEVELVAGETLVTAAWIAAPRDRDRFGAEFVVTAVDPPAPHGGGDSTRVGVRFDESADVARIRDHPLARRPRPALPRLARRVPPFEALLGAWAALFLVAAVASRLGSSRPWLAAPVCAMVGCGAGIGLLLLSGVGSAAGGAAAAAVRVLDGEIEQGGAVQWIQVDRVRGALMLEAGLDAPPGHVEIADGRPWRTRLQVRDGRALATIEAAPAVGVDLLRSASPGLRLLRSEINTWGDLDLAWSREASGAWSAHGPWAFGAPLPGTVRAAAPPAWCVVGLVAEGEAGENGSAEAFVGRVQTGGFAGQGGAGPAPSRTGPFRLAGAPSAGILPPTEAWVRLTRR